MFGPNNFYLQLIIQFLLYKKIKENLELLKHWIFSQLINLIKIGRKLILKLKYYFSFFNPWFIDYFSIFNFLDYNLNINNFFLFYFKKKKKYFIYIQNNKSIQKKIKNINCVYFKGNKKKINKKKFHLLIKKTFLWYFLNYLVNSDFNFCTL
jgi:hypothetical protein